jgi:hypothetical protein
MSQDPNSQFDQTVIEMIEHSPGGTVPGTPSYQDALKRLYAAQKVYANADRKDGHVTARSLAAAPQFHASNLREFMAGAVAAEALEANTSIFARYLASLAPALRPRAETFRQKVVGRPVHHRAKHLGAEKLPPVHDLLHSLFMVPGTGPHPGLPGNYLYGSVVEAAPGAAHGPWSVHVHDSDDGDAVYDTSTVQEAFAKLQEVLDSAPFNMNELAGLDFKML